MNRYDQLIKDAAAEHLPGVDWRLLKAQLKKESGFDPQAKSPVGALASYNAGTKHLLKAQELAGNVNDYARIIAALPHVTGPKNALETRDYVRKIFGFFTSYILEGNA